MVVSVVPNPMSLDVEETHWGQRQPPGLVPPPPGQDLLQAAGLPEPAAEGGAAISGVLVHRWASVFQSRHLARLLFRPGLDFTKGEVAVAPAPTA
jgi:hypothetical protein